jgi:S1-C subfamily serine protease
MAVTGLDWIIVAFAALLASFGFRRGFIVGALSFAGFALGAFVGTRIGPLLLPDGSSSPYAPAFGLLGALLAGAILASGLEGVGLRVRRALVIPGLGLLDGVLGAALGAALGLGIVWILAAVAAQAPSQSQLRADIQRSSILRELNVLLPPTGPLLNALARLDRLPHITGPSANVPAPLPQIAAAPGIRRAAPSVVRVLGSACGLAIEGSGWVAEPETVVTNAHVVAGEQDTTVEVGGRQPQLPATPIAFDSTDDVAVLHVPRLALQSLALAQDPASGTPGAILGYPENGAFAVRPARIGRTQSVDTQDAYGRGPVTRLLTPLVGVVHPGNSGGPLVDSDGRVLTTVFAGTVGGSTPGGYGVANSSVAASLAQAQAHARAGLQAGTEGCAGG